MKFVYRFFSHLYDIVFPPSKDARLVQTLDTVTIGKIYVCRSVDGVYTLSAYSDPRIRALVHEAKFKGNEHSFLLLGTLLSLHIGRLEHINYILPIPLSKKRMRARGYNQVAEVVRRATCSPHTIIRTDILERSRDTQPQTELQRAERLVNVRNAFGVADGSEITGKHIIIIDDVMTTGATLRAAKATLLQHSPASVTCVALAH
ncbi:ComF family protein [Candidatus Kaiserbacteria bacterium]|nr:MAG: ComF family protein [Candidatus Kaiserbacteria bacterium]